MRFNSDLNKFGKDVLLRSISIFFTLATVAVVARIISPEDIGTYLRLGILHSFVQTLLDVALMPVFIKSSNGGHLNSIVVNVLKKRVLLILTPLIVIFGGYWLFNGGSNFIYLSMMLLICGLSFFSTILCSFLSINNHVSSWSKVLIKSEIIALVCIYVLSFVVNDGVMLFSMRFVIFYSCSIFFAIWVKQKELQNKSIISKGVTSEHNGDDLLVFASSNYLTRHADSILISFNFSAEILGLYNRAMQISRYPQIALVSSLSQILLPTLNVHRISAESMKSWINYFHIYFFLGNIVSLILMHFADAYVLLILGDNWKQATDFIIYFFSTLTMQLYLGATNALFIHFNSSRAYRNLGITSGVISTCLVLLAINFSNITYVAYAFVASTALSFILSFTFFAYSILKIGSIGTILLLLNASVPVILVLFQ